MPTQGYWSSQIDPYITPDFFRNTLATLAAMRKKNWSKNIIHPIGIEWRIALAKSSRPQIRLYTFRSTASPLTLIGKNETQKLGFYMILRVTPKKSLPDVLKGQSWGQPQQWRCDTIILTWGKLTDSPLTCASRSRKSTQESNWKCGMTSYPPLLVKAFNKRSNKWSLSFNPSSLNSSHIRPYIIRRQMLRFESTSAGYSWINGSSHPGKFLLTLISSAKNAS